MTHRIIRVSALENFVISAVFQNGTEKYYCIEKLLKEFPQFEELKRDGELFESVKVDVGGYGISWNDELDLSADEIWEAGETIEGKHEVDACIYVGYQLQAARKAAGMTQKELAAKTGIYQADISNIERGRANPSVQTLQKLAEGMEMKIKIEFLAETK